MAVITTPLQISLPSSRCKHGSVKLWIFTATQRAGMTKCADRTCTHPVETTRAAASAIRHVMAVQPGFLNPFSSVLFF